MHIMIAYAAPGVASLTEVVLPEGSVLADAITKSGVIEQLQLDVRKLGYAIHGQRAQADTPLRDGDRIDLTRPLVADPKTARLARARANPLRRRNPRRTSGLLR
jgi:uncharacterized protein